jgi:predicted hydrolase (HD superfamily)
MHRTEAISIVREYVKNENLIRHMLAVEAGMRFYAELYGEDEEVWGITPHFRTTPPGGRNYP